MPATVEYCDVNLNVERESKKKLGDEKNNKGCSMHYEFFSRYSFLLVVAIFFSDISFRSNLLAFALLVNMIKWPVFLFLDRIKYHLTQRVGDFFGILF